jgi:outer membrane translocation and assembly module TamA
MSAMNDPLIQQLIGQNPRAPQIQAAMMAHISEHVAYAYRQKIEQQMGVALPPEDEKLPPQVEMALSSMMAQAAQQVLQENKAQVAQEQAQEQMQDPVVQMQMQELKIKEREVGVKEQKAQMDATIAAQRLELDKEKTQADIQLGGLKAASQIEMDKQKFASSQQAEGVRLGIEGQKVRDQADAQRRQSVKPPKGE